MTEQNRDTATIAIPPALAFLVSNFQSLVTIKLDSTNYLLWKTQIHNALRANGFFGYLDGTMKTPDSKISDTNNNLVDNPEYVKWCLIDSQLLSCLTATLYASTLPLVLGFEHAYQVWQSLEYRFNSLTRTHVHEFKRRLYNITKTGTMESYIDQIKDYANRLTAAGFPVSDDDLIFHTLNGLPEEEFRGFRTAIHTRGGTFSFDELVTMLNVESLTNTKTSHLESVFLTTAKSVDASHPAVHNSTNMFTPPSLLPSSQSSSSGYTQPAVSLSPASMSQGGSSSQVISYPTQDNRTYSRNMNFDNNGRRGGYNNYGGNTQNGCQICGKTNHIAFYCYHRQNLAYQPSQPFQFQNSSQNLVVHSPQPYENAPQNFSFRGPWKPSSVPQNRGTHGFVQQGYMAPSHQAHFVSAPSYFVTESVQGPMSVSLGFQQYSPGMTEVHQFPMPSPGPVPIVSQGSDKGAPIGQNGQVMAFSTQSVQSTPASSQPWVFDSGATTHVTHDLSNLSLHQPYTGSQGLAVGNGATIPIAHSGQGNTSSPLQGPLPTRTLSTTELI